MSFLYLWQSANCPHDAATRAFKAMIDRQRALYEAAFGHPVTAHICQIESIFIGLVAYPTGVRGWDAWQQQDQIGIAWSGVCEDMLGQPAAPAALHKTIAAITARPRSVAAWEGRFAVCTWDSAAKQATLTTSAVDSPALWYTSGPYGWAAGSKALPLLALVGRTPALDTAAAGIFVSYGYHAGTTGLFQHATRLGSRQHVTVSPHQVAIQTYVTLSDYVNQGDAPAQWSDLVNQQAERLIGRVRRQMQHSEQPKILLTGGRDSRCIAAAVVAGGHTCDAETSGPSSSIDVKLAAQVSQTLGITHRREQRPPSTAPTQALLHNADRLQLWMELTEGVQTIRHALAFQPFFEQTLPFPAGREQAFHGLHALGGSMLSAPALRRSGHTLHHPVDVSAARAVMTDRIVEQLACRREAQAAIDVWLDRFDADTAAMNASWATWFNLIYWQNRALQWGEDDMSTKDVMAWHWTSLLDGSLTRAYLHLPQRDGIGKKLIEDITVAMAPALGAIRYDKRPPSPLTYVKKGVKWTLQQAQRYGVPLPAALRKQRTKLPVDHDLLQFWDAIFFRPGAFIWRDLVDEAFVRATIAKQPSAEVLWNLATVELAARATIGAIH